MISKIFHLKDRYTDYACRCELNRCSATKLIKVSEIIFESVSDYQKLFRNMTCLITDYIGIDNVQ